MTLSGAVSTRLHVWFARGHRRIGWPGWIGLGLLVVAAAIVGMARCAEVPSDVVAGPAVAQTTRGPSAMGPASAKVPTMSLPRRDDVPLLLTQIELAAVRNALGWRAADYRLTAATEAEPGRLEVHCSLKGAYPQLRRWLTQVLGSVPGAGLRELTLTRSGSDSSEVEAKLVLAVWLQDAAAAGTRKEAAAR